MYQQNTNGLGEWDFGSIVDTLVKGYSGYAQTKAQTNLMKLQMQQAQQQAQQQAALQNYLTTYNPNYSATYGGGIPQTQNNLMPILLIAGVALAAFFILKK